MRRSEILKNMSCPFSGAKKGDGVSLDASKCPAFTDGCPYKGVMQMSKEQLAKCPAFVEGCPFKADTTLEAFVSRLEGMKASPAIAKCPAFKDGGCPFSEMLAKDKVHRAACCTRCAFRPLVLCPCVLLAQLHLFFW